MIAEEHSEHQVKYITALGSVAHTYGNLLATAQKWVLDIFPNNLFKTIHVSSNIAHKQILSTPHQFLKKQRPMIIFRPRISYNEDTFLKGTLITERMGGPLTSSTPGTIELNPFLFDSERMIDCQFSLARRIMYLDITISFETLIQQMNYFEYLYQEIPVDRPFDIDTHLEAYLSKELMDMISKLSGVPMHDEIGCVKDFLNYMNSHSCYPVTYKLAGSTGKEEFYRYYPAKIITTITDLDRTDGENMNQVTGNYQISFSMKMEFWSPGTTYLFSDNIHEIPRPEVPTDSTLIPIYADIFMYEDLDLNPGWSVYSHASYTLDKPEDALDFSPLLQESIREVIKYHLKNGIPMLNFLDIKVRKQGTLLPYGKGYEVDFEKLQIQFHNKDYGFYTYTVIISIDTNYINQLIKEIFNLK